MIAWLVTVWASLSGALCMVTTSTVRVKRHGWDKEEEDDEHEKQESQWFEPIAHVCDYVGLCSNMFVVRS